MTHRREGASAWWASTGEVVRPCLRWHLKNSCSRAFIAVWVSTDKLALPIANRPCCQGVMHGHNTERRCESKRSRRSGGVDLRGPRSSIPVKRHTRDALKLPFALSLHPAFIPPLSLFFRIPPHRPATFRGAQPLTSLPFPHFISRINHVVSEPGPSKYRHGQAQSAPQQWRRWIRAQLVPWSTVHYHTTSGLRRSEPRNFDSRVSHGW